MSTRSHIGLLLEDGRIESIYCHNDGYLSHNGHILDSFYNDIKIDFRKFCHRKLKKIKFKLISGTDKISKIVKEMIKCT